MIKGKPMNKRYIKLSPKNQLTLPKSIINRFPGTQYFEIGTRENEVVLRPARMLVQGDTLKRVRDKIKSLGLKEDIVTEAIRNTRNNA
jgi:hypothetical protein